MRSTNTFTYTATTNDILIQSDSYRTRQFGEYYVDNIFISYPDTVAHITQAPTPKNYRYGFNGMEKDDEVSGARNSYDFGARMYNPRVGRWMSVDPLAGKYPHLSPYSFVANSPLIFNDIEGYKIIPAEGLTANQLTRVKAAIKKVEETLPELYNYLNTLKYNPNIKGGTFVSQGEEGYNDEEAYDVNIVFGVSNIDGRERTEEILDEDSYSGNSFKLSGNVEADLAGEAKFGSYTHISSIAKKGNDGSFQTYNSKRELVSIKKPDELKDFTPILKNFIRLSGKEFTHFVVNLDDYNGGSDVDASVTAHEFGHIEGFIKFQLNTAYFMVIGLTNAGHEIGNKSGEQAETREKEFNEKQ